MTDLLGDVQAAQRGYIGAGVYTSTSNREGAHASPRGSEEELDLLEAGEVNREIGDASYVFEPPQGEEEQLFSGEGEGDCVVVADYSRYYQCDQGYQEQYGQHIILASGGLVLERPPACTAAAARSEILSTASRRGVQRLAAESRKHQQFYGGVRIH